MVATMLAVLHTLLATFTVVLIPISLFSDLLGILLRKESLRATGWWTAVYAAVLIPLAALTGWVRSMASVHHPQQQGHTWLGVGMVGLLALIVLGRLRVHGSGRVPGAVYLLLMIVLSAVGTYQNDLGRKMGLGPGGLSTQDHCSMPGLPADPASPQTQRAGHAH
jgi:uncharacterized membrane protein